MNMRKLNTSLLAGLAVTSLFYAASGVADDDSDKFKARLQGYSEVPAVSSTGTGQFRARIIGETIEFELTYQNLEGTTTNAAHVHFGNKWDAGGVSYFLCGGTRPACTPTSGTFMGTVVAADVIGPNAQGIAPGEIAEIIRAMRAGVTYANVHTNKHPGGEIRGQVRADDDDDDD
jgi:hypothetical protein